MNVEILIALEFSIFSDTNNLYKQKSSMDTKTTEWKVVGHKIFTGTFQSIIPQITY